MSQRDPTRLVVTCPECEVQRGIDDVNEAVAYYRRHHSLTGHDIEWERADIDDLSVVSSEDLTSIISDLEEQLGESVPIGLVTVVLSRRGVSIGQTLESIRDLRMNGDLYEPRDDHLRVT